MIPLTLLTSIGHITVERRYLACPACKAKSIPWNDWAAVGERRLTEPARRMLTLAGMTWSFDLAAKRLAELCHLKVSDDTIERVCQEEGQQAQQFMKDSPAPAAAFQAKGEAEFYTDGVQVNKHSADIACNPSHKAISNGTIIHGAQLLELPSNGNACREVGAGSRIVNDIFGRGSHSNTISPFPSTVPDVASSLRFPW